MIVILEGSEIQSESDLHSSIASQIGFGPDYGQNLSALWDRLTTDVERPLILELRDSSACQKSLGESLYRRITELFRDVERNDQTLGLKERFELRIR